MKLNSCFFSVYAIVATKRKSCFSWTKFHTIFFYNFITYNLINTKLDRFKLDPSNFALWYEHELNFCWYSNELSNLNNVWCKERCLILEVMFLDQIVLSFNVVWGVDYNLRQVSKELDLILLLAHFRPFNSLIFCCTKIWILKIGCR